LVKNKKFKFMGKICQLAQCDSYGSRIFIQNMKAMQQEDSMVSLLPVTPSHPFKYSFDLGQG